MLQLPYLLLISAEMTGSLSFFNIFIFANLIFPHSVVYSRFYRISSFETNHVFH